MGDGDDRAAAGEVQQGDAALVLGVEVGDVAQGHFGDVHRLHLELAVRHQGSLALHGIVGGGHRIAHVAAALGRQAEGIDGRLLHRAVEHVFDLPADGGLEFVLADARRVDHQELVLLRLQDPGTGRLLQAVGGHQFAQGGVLRLFAAGLLEYAQVEPGPFGPREDVGEGYALAAQVQAYQPVAAFLLSE